MIYLWRWWTYRGSSSSSYCVRCVAVTGTTYRHELLNIACSHNYLLRLWGIYYFLHCKPIHIRQNYCVSFASSATIPFASVTHHHMHIYSYEILRQINVYKYDIKIYLWRIYMKAVSPGHTILCHIYVQQCNCNYIQ